MVSNLSFVVCVFLTFLCSTFAVHDEGERYSQAANGVHLGGRPLFNVSIRFRTQNNGKQTTLSLVRNGFKRADSLLQRKLEKRFRLLGPIDSSTDAIVVRWESTRAGQVRYTFTMAPTVSSVKTGIQGTGRSGRIPKKRTCVGLIMKCTAPVTSPRIMMKTVTVFLWMTFANNAGENFFTILLSLKRACGPGQCQPPPSLPYGEIVLGETSRCRPGQVIYRCLAGYRPVGCSVSRCEDGQWLCSEPRCAPDWLIRWEKRRAQLAENVNAVCKPGDEACGRRIDPPGTSGEACFNITVPRSLEALSHILCASDYVVKATLHRLDRQETGKLSRRGQVQVIDYEPLMENRTLPSDPGPMYIRLSGNLRHCTDLIDQLVDGDGEFLVTGMRSRHTRRSVRIVVGKRSFDAPEHGVLLLYEELNRYYRSQLRKARKTGLGSQLFQQNTLSEFIHQLQCSSQSG